MSRKSIRKEIHHTVPDHRPMIPEMRGPKDPIELAVRSHRMRCDEFNPIEHKKWR